MAQFNNYPQKGFSASDKLLAQDPSGSGAVSRVTGQSILEAAANYLRQNGDIVVATDTRTEALAGDYGSGVYVLCGGLVSLFDGGESIYRVSDPGSGGMPMANGNELVEFPSLLGQLLFTKVEYTNVAGQSTFNFVYPISLVQVLLNGVLLAEADYTATDGVTITLANPIDNNSDILTFIRYAAADGTIGTGTMIDEDAKDYTKRVDSISELPLVGLEGNQQVSVKGYHAGSDVGGGLFIWNTSARHNGVTNFDPARANEIGTAAYYVDSGSDAACWVRVDYEKTIENAGGFGDGVNDDTDAIKAAYKVFLSVKPKSGAIYLFSETIEIYKSNSDFGYFNAAIQGWDTAHSDIQFLWTGDAISPAFVIGGTANSGFSLTGNNDIENIAFGGFSVVAKSGFTLMTGLLIDGSVVNDANRGFARNITLYPFAIDDCTSHNIHIIGDVFDVKGYNTTSRKPTGGACVKAEIAATYGSPMNPDQINFFAPMFFAKTQAAPVDTSLWAVDGYGIQTYGGNIQGSLAFKMRSQCGVFGTHIEHEGAGPVGSIGVEILGNWCKLEPKWIVGYEKCLKVGDGAENFTGPTGTIPLIDGKSIATSIGIEVVAGGARQGRIEVGEFKNCNQNVVDNRGLGEFSIRNFNNRDYQTSFRTASLTLVSGSDYSISANRGELHTITYAGATRNLVDITNAEIGMRVTVVFATNDVVIKIVGNPLFDSSAKIDITPQAFSAYDFLYDGTRWIVIGQ